MGLNIFRMKDTLRLGIFMLPLVFLLFKIVMYSHVIVYFTFYMFLYLKASGIKVVLKAFSLNCTGSVVYYAVQDGSTFESGRNFLSVVLFIMQYKVVLPFESE